MRVIVVAGARPNFIKIGPLMPALIGAGIDAKIAHTGQHYDALMSDIFFDDLAIPQPSWSLEVGSGSHATQTGTAMMRLEELFIAEKPDAVLVVGDVNSTLAASLAAVKLGVPVVHVEAGLRSWDPTMPEEINRLITDKISSLLLTSIEGADKNLVAEGIGPERIHFVGNIMAESLLLNRNRATKRNAFERYGLQRKGYILSTCHRPENTDNIESLSEIIAALQQASLPVLLLAHPRTLPVLKELGAGDSSGNIIIADPVGYLDMVSLQSDAALIVSDSGGIQEEACLLHTPCVTVRRNTERQITVEIGSNRLASATQSSIQKAISEALSAPSSWEIPAKWDTQVGARIAELLLCAHKEGFPSIEQERM